MKCGLRHKFMRFIMSKQFCLLSHDKSCFFLQYCCLSQSSFNHAVFGYISANIPGHGRVPNHWSLDLLKCFTEILSRLTDGRALSHKHSSTDLHGRSCVVYVCHEIFATPKLYYICQGD